MLFTLSIFVSSIWFLAFVATQMLHKDMETLSSEQQLSTATFVAAGINQEIEQRRDALVSVAKTITPQLLKNPEQLQIHLQSQGILPIFFNGGGFITALDGISIATTFPNNQAHINYADRDYIKDVIKDEQPIIGSPVISKMSGHPSFTMAVPIQDAHRHVIGVLAGATDLSTHNFLEHLTDAHYGKEGGYLLIAPQARRIVTANDKWRTLQPLPAEKVNPSIDLILKEQEGSLTYNDARGVEVLSSFKQIPLTGWIVVVSIPTDEVFAPIHIMRNRMLIITAILTLLAAGLTWWMLKRQLAPILHALSTLTTHAKLVDAYARLTPLPITQFDEIGELIAGFNRLLLALQQREDALSESEARFHNMADHAPALIWMSDTQNAGIWYNKRWLTYTGRSMEQLLGIGWLEDVHPNDRARCESLCQAAFQQRHKVDLEYRLRRANGNYGWIADIGVPRFDTNGNFLGYIGYCWDITERKHAEEKLKLAASVFTHAREGIMITDSDGTIIDVNQAFSRITGYHHNEVLGRNPRLLSSGRQTKDYYAALWRGLIEQGHWYSEVWNRRKNGEVYAAMQTISAVKDAHGHTLQYVALFSDITSLKEHQNQLEHIAHYDALTNLPNRVLLADRLRQGISQSQRHQHLLAVVFLDLDGFKAVNDNHGHEAGDQLLITVSNRMKQVLRDGDTLARLGGDEFVAVLLELESVDSSLEILTRLREAAARPVQFGDVTLQVSASLGVTFYPQGENIDADQLMRQADQAMYQAKLAGKNRYFIFDAAQDVSIRDHHESLERITQALNAKEFVLHYQPKVNMRTGTVIGAEALIRWQHPQKELLAPKEFLPIVEDHPLSVMIGEWVIDSALNQVSTWQAAGFIIPISVNVGVRQLQELDFPDRLQNLLNQYPDINPNQLELEVLETSTLEDVAQISQTILQCQALGVTFSLDDFGTGYSSLTYLKRLPVNLLKIDQSFVHNMLDDPDDLAILEGILGLATAFHRQVIAEGVETIAHGTLLLQLGCDLAQGFGIAHPMLASEIPDWVANWHANPAWQKPAPAHQDELPLLFASAEHHAWVSVLEAYLHDKASAPPPLNETQCHFAHWLEGRGLVRYGTHPTFSAIAVLHKQTHALAVELYDLKLNGNALEAQSRILELHCLRDSLIQKLNTLAQDSQWGATSPHPQSI
ncbi:MAG: EAL domain-containing protein [Gallionella sp.]|nr:EAL domain-containing protein [Gallionella sp.]MDD4958733.1 EAL domain-containing protein [Gallionella sp.]